MEWLAAKALGIPRGLWLIIAAALLVWGVVAAFDNTVEQGLDTAKEAGASGAVIAGNKVTLDQVGVAHEAGNDIRNDVGFARYCECLRSSTDATAGNCVRYLEHKPVPDRSDDSDSYCAKAGN